MKKLQSKKSTYQSDLVPCVTACVGNDTKLVGEVVCGVNDMNEVPFFVFFEPLNHMRYVHFHDLQVFSVVVTEFSGFVLEIVQKIFHDQVLFPVSIVTAMSGMLISVYPSVLAEVIIRQKVDLKASISPACGARAVI